MIGATVGCSQMYTGEHRNPPTIAGVYLTGNTASIYEHAAKDPQVSTG